MGTTVKDACLDVLLELVGKRFVAGKSRSDAIRVAHTLNSSGRAVTINFLGEHIRNEKVVLATLQEYLALLDDIARYHLNASISVKLTQLGLLIDERLCRIMLSQLIAKAAALQIPVEFDMEDSKLTTKILDFYKECFATYPNLRVALQAYLRRTEQDLQDLESFEHARVRLCKGAYRESKAIAQPNMFRIKVAFLQLIPRAFRTTDLPAIATHDRDIIEMVSKNYASMKSMFEFQMLMGIEQRLQDNLVRHSFQLRVYVPYGKEWFSYGFRRIRFLATHLAAAFR